jgi:mannose-6-phosphate isomerase-like protein (cupin superfamily)
MLETIESLLSANASRRCADISGLERYELIGDVVTLLLTGESTNDAYFLCEFFSPVGSGAGMPLHTHLQEEQYYRVIDGLMGYEVGGVLGIAEPGDTVHFPKGVPHRTWNMGSTDLRALMLAQPAGIENVFRRYGTPIDGHLPRSFNISAEEIQSTAANIFATCPSIVSGQPQ